MAEEPLDRKEKFILNKAKLHPETGRLIIPKLLGVEMNIQMKTSTKQIVDKIESIERKRKVRFQPVPDYIKKDVMHFAKKEKGVYKIPNKIHRQVKHDSVLVERAIREMIAEGVPLKRVTKTKHNAPWFNELRARTPVVHDEKERERILREKRMEKSVDVDFDKEIKRTKEYLNDLPPEKRSGEVLMDLAHLSKGSDLDKIREILDKYSDEI